MPKAQLDSDFWRDEFIHDLSVNEKLVFIYLITSPASNIAGIYQLPMYEISAHTGIQESELIEIFEKFTEANKILYRDVWVCIKNRLKYNKQDNPSIQTGVKRITLSAPDFIKDFLKIKIKEADIKERHEGSSNLPSAKQLEAEGF